MNRKILSSLSTGILCYTLATPGHAAIALDRTRVIVEGDQKSVSLSVSNENPKLPYLAQGWIEDEMGNKISSPMLVLPPVQRIEPGGRSQVRIQTLPAINTLPQDRETLYYFNLREIPPRSNKPNTLQLALQTRIKLFFRPKALVVDSSVVPWQEKLILIRNGDRYQVRNPTPYYVTLTEASNRPGGEPLKSFSPLMIAPRSEASLGVNVSALGSTPVLTYINDYGGRPQLKFSCRGNQCSAAPVTDK
ncbi:TPA: fimbria/pilus periplasmic chaperone [Enterobacter roggenkampii]|nr:fimbria/pilus periplasmic chaperone [Enterobacter roggenkampii]